MGVESPRWQITRDAEAPAARKELLETMVNLVGEQQATRRRLEDDRKSRENEKRNVKWVWKSVGCLWSLLAVDAAMGGETASP